VNNSTGRCDRCPSGCDKCYKPSLCEECSYGYFDLKWDGNCQKCDSNCKSCGSRGCQTCYTGYYPDQNTGLCKKCKDTLSNCNSCSSKDKCDECDDPYFINSWTKRCDKCGAGCGSCVSADRCTTCKDSQCLSCEPSGCKRCKSGFGVDSYGECSRCATGCADCSTNVKFCNQCQSGYFDIDGDGTCEKCDSNCLKCGSKGCLSCKAGFVVNSDTGKCEACSKYLPNCNSCAVNDYCDGCSDPYFANRGSCELCGPACGSCLSADKCTSCKANRCVECDTQACKSCSKFYGVNEAGTCSSCATGCDFCSSNSTICNQCSTGYFDLVMNGTCQECDPVCTKCGPRGCEVCPSGYYVNNQTGLCSTCSSAMNNCDTCNDDKYCQRCLDPFFSNNGVCEACGPSCASCLSLDTCTKCKDTNCKDCDPQGGCRTCNYGYFPDENTGKCISCASTIAKCDHCTSKDQCKICVDPFYAEDGSCHRCGPSCDSCLDGNTCSTCSNTYCEKCSPNTCDACFNGYGVNKEAGCSACAKGCDICAKNMDVCDQCSKGYFDLRANGTCQACDKNCKNCGPRGCLTCNTGYFPDTETGGCALCSGAMANCTACASANYCDSCQDTLFSKNGVCTSCGPACGTCENEYACTTCLETECVECNTQKCLKCSKGHGVDEEGECSPCSLGCAVCSKNVNYCESCAHGFFDLKRKGTCQAQDRNCETQDIFAGCQKCARGYIVVKETGLCEKCDDSCVDCTTSRDQCTQCSSFYMSKDSESRCKTSKTFLFLTFVALASLGYLALSYIRKQKRDAHGNLNEEFLSRN